MNACKLAFLALALFAVANIASAAESPATASEIAWGTFLGGADHDLGFRVRTDYSGNIYLAGNTKSEDFPVTANVHDHTYGGGLWGDVFVSKFAPNGSLLWSTFLGGAEGEYCKDLAVDSAGNVYLAGWTVSSDFPVPGGRDRTYHGGAWGDVFVAKLDSNGKLVWATYHGGADSERARGIAVTSDGYVYVTGWTSSADFPAKQALDPTFNGGGSNRSEGGDVILSKFSTDGTLVWSTFLGGSRDEIGNAVAIHQTPGERGASGPQVVYVVGDAGSSDFPTPRGFDDSIDGGSDAFLAAFDGDGALLWATFLGGSSGDWGTDVAIDSHGNPVIAGYTHSPEFPHPDGSAPGRAASRDAFAAKFDSEGSLTWATYVGGSKLERALAITLDAEDRVLVAGETNSKDMPMVAEGNSHTQNYDAFVSLLDLDGKVLWSSYIGGSLADAASGIALDRNGNAYVAGATASPDFPATGGYRPTHCGEQDAFLVKLSPQTQPSASTSTADPSAK